MLHAFTRLSSREAEWHATFISRDYKDVIQKKSNIAYTVLLHVGRVSNILM